MGRSRWRGTPAGAAGAARNRVVAAAREPVQTSNLPFPSRRSYEPPDPFPRVATGREPNSDRGSSPEVRDRHGYFPLEALADLPAVDDHREGVRDDEDADAPR